mgnify:CR=1 FL=1
MRVNSAAGSAAKQSIGRLWSGYQTLEPPAAFEFLSIVNIHGSSWRRCAAFALKDAAFLVECDDGYDCDRAACMDFI